MLTFPVLSISPSYDFDDEPIDSSIVSQSEANYKQARPRVTRPQRKFSKITYPVLLAAEKLILQNFDQQVGSWTPFYWPHPLTGVIYVVIFSKASRPKFTAISNTCYSCTFDLEEV